jgi:hypothetical protein
VDDLVHDQDPLRPEVLEMRKQNRNAQRKASGAQARSRAPAPEWSTGNPYGCTEFGTEPRSHGQGQQAIANGQVVFEAVEADVLHKMKWNPVRAGDGTRCWNLLDSYASDEMDAAVEWLPDQCND